MSYKMTYKEASKIDWQRCSEERFPGIDAVYAGSLMRIADATEAMAKNYVSLLNDAERYRKWYIEESNKTSRLQKKITNLERA